MARTIPDSFPLIAARDFFSHRVARASLIRKLALAQNYLWAKTCRIYASSAYEGWGTMRYEGFPYTAPELNLTVPLINFTGQSVASFIVPPNSGAGQKLQIKGRSVISTTSGGATGYVVAEMLELDGTSLGQYASVNYAVNGSNDWSMVIYPPQDRFIQVRIYSAHQFLNPGDFHGVSCLSARYLALTTAELGVGGSSVSSGGMSDTWNPIAYAALAADDALSSALLTKLVEDTNHLWNYRAPEICQSWLHLPGVGTSTWTEIGRYTVYIPSRVTTISGKLYVYCTHSGSNTGVRVLINGSVAGTSSASTGDSEISFSSLAVTDKAESVITIEARSDAGGSGGDWGTNVWGVSFWEDGIDLALPSGNTVPSDYQPLDDDLLDADEAIVAEDLGTVRAGIKTLIENNIWLARHRMRWLIGDWRHRTLKRINSVTGSLTSPTVYTPWDWTPGGDNSTALPAPKNITLAFGLLDASNSSPPSGQDGLAGWQFGYAISGNDGFVTGGTSIWPLQGDFTRWKRGGNRLGRYFVETGTSTSSISSVSTARYRWMARGRRLTTAVPNQNFNGVGPSLSLQMSPNSTEGFFKNQGSFALQAGTPLVLQVTSSDRTVSQDTVPRWYGPVFGLHADLGSGFDILGSCPHVAGAYNSPSGELDEGAVFEMELQSCLIMDEPLTQDDINALA